MSTAPSPPSPPAVGKVLSGRRCEMTVFDDIAQHNVPGPTYSELLDSDRFEVPDTFRWRAEWPENLSHSVPRDRYLSEEVHALEDERMWRRAWQMVCRIEHLPKPNDSILYEINGRED